MRKKAREIERERERERDPSIFFTTNFSRPDNEMLVLSMMDNI